MYNIKVQYEGRTILLKHIHAGQSLLQIILNNKISLRHDCGGIAACSSCHIYVDKGNEYIESKSRREEHLLAKSSNAKETSRLACQCVLLKNSGEIELTFPPQSNKENN